MAIVEGYWDCPYCGTTGIRGRYQTCSNCGKTRSATTKFYMKETAPVEDESVVEKGPDWFCPYCDSYNHASDTVCKNCGHPRDTEDKNYFEVRREETRKQTERLREEQKVVHSEPKKTNYSAGSSSSFSGRTSYSVSSRNSSAISPKRIGLIALVLLLVGLMIWGIVPKNKTLTVLDTEWTRTIEVQQYRLVEDDDWKLPRDAVELLYTQSEIHHYDQILDRYETVTEQKSRQVQDGYDTWTTYEDMGNGYFKSVEHSSPKYKTEYYTETHQEPVYRSVPVYETKYYYTIWKWVHERTETSSGQTDPYWPDIQYAEDEREGRKTEEYSVLCENAKGKESSYKCNYDLWSQIRMGDTINAKIQMGNIIELK